MILGTQCGNCVNLLLSPICRKNSVKSKHLLRNHGILLSLIFGKNFVKATFLLKKSLNSWFDEIFFRWEKISVISTVWHCELTLWKNEKFSLMPFCANSNFFREISTAQIFFSWNGKTWITKSHFCSNFAQDCADLS